MRGCRFLLIFLGTWGAVLQGLPNLLIGQELETLRSSPQLFIDSQGFRGRVESLAFSRDGRFLAGTGEQDIRIWNIETSELVAVLRGERSHGAYGKTWSVAFSPDGQFLLAGVDDHSLAGSIRVYQLKNGRWQQGGLISGTNLPTREIRFSPDGQYFATCSENGEIHLWNWSNRQRLAAFEPKSQSTSGYLFFDFWRQPELSLIGLNDKMFAVSVATRQERQYPKSSNFNQLFTLIRNYAGNAMQNPGSEYLFDSGAQAAVFATFDEQTGGNVVASAFRLGTPDPIAIFRGHSTPISSLAITGDGKNVASGDLSGDIHVWSTAQNQKTRTYSSLCKRYEQADWLQEATDVQGRRSNSLRLLNHQDPGVSYHVDLLSRSTKLHKVSSRPVRSELLNFQDFSISVSNSGDSHNTGGIVECLKNGKRIGRFQWESGRTTGKYTYVPRNTLRGNPTVIIADREGSLVAWNGSQDDHLLLREFIGHSAEVTSLSVSPDGTMLVSASLDGTVRIWPLNNPHPEGGLDCALESNRVEKIREGSKTAAAGMQQGDTIVSIGEYSLLDTLELKLQKKFPYRVGQKVPVKIIRGKASLTLNVELSADADLVEPLLSYFATKDGEWIVWTPQGYYDSSPGAARLIGWLENRGKKEDAVVYPAIRFQEQFYRPDIISKVVSTSELTQEEFDLRDGSDLASLRPPEIKILSPTPRQAFPQANEIPIKISMGASELNRVESVDFFHDSQLILTVHPSRDQSEVTERIETSPGNHVVEVRVRTSKGITSEPVSVAFSVAGNQRQKSKPKLFIAAVGVSKFKVNESEKSNYADLKYAAEDAAAFVETVKSHAGLFTDIDPLIMQNEEATRENIIESLASYQSHPDMTTDDYFFLYLSSHGDINGKKKDYVFIPHDVVPDKLTARAIDWRQIARLIQQIPAKNRFLFVDTCKAGAIAGDQRDPLHTLQDVIIFASSNASQNSEELDRLKHGVFAAAIIQAVRNSATDKRPQKGIIDVHELMEGISHEMSRLSTSQQPVFFPKQSGVSAHQLEILKVN